ncbi:Bacterial DNA-binding protein [compost metagenome]
MDVAKYIGLFLHKYQYCYLPNLGNFLVTRKPALQKGDQMEGPQYQVSFTFANGSIDDALANFIATNERISIANAANAIKDFCTQTREALTEGKEVTIPGFGKFVRIEGKNNFVSDQNIEVQTRTIPYFKTHAPAATTTGETISQMYEKMQLKEPTIDEEIVIKPPMVNWSKIIILALIVLAILGAGIGIYWYMSKDNNDAVPKVENAAPEAAAVQNDTATATTPPPAAQAAAAPSNGYNYAILQFTDKAAADKKLDKLKSFGQDSYGKDLSLKDNGAGVYYITMSVASNSDTAVVKDSLRKFFNPNGSVFIVK